VGIDLALERDTKNLVSLGPSALGKHCAVLGQAGSGKSFMLGRLLEELLIKTKANVVIFDPHSDYACLNKLNANIWTNAKCQLTVESVAERR
jgi:DNA helicase HerA-like ATPase